MLGKGEHAGFEWIVVHNGMGHRCGYVRVPVGHPWHGWHYSDERDIGVSVHGGVTFAEADVPCGKGGADDAWWLGFDCAHCHDARDPELPIEMPPGLGRALVMGGTVRTQEYVEGECRRLCEQALEASAQAYASSGKEGA